MYHLKGCRKKLILFVLVLAVNARISSVFAWGLKGHTIVAEIAWSYLSDATKRQIIMYLQNMPLDSAANWMDAMRSNPDYDFMKPWHFINLDKGDLYTPSVEDNIANRLTLTYNELKHKKLLGSDQVRFDLLVLFHLIGDIHQPLHVGYKQDKGGNARQVEFLSYKTNLHHVWDENIIETASITTDECLSWGRDLSSNDLKKVQAIDFVQWMNESRSLVDTAYDFPGFMLDEDYAGKAVVIVKKRLFYAGIRLAAVLEKLFVQPAPVINNDSLASTLKNGILIKDAINHVGKKVTVCARVYGVKTTDKVTFLNLGARFPNAPLTVVIFAKDRASFSQPIDELYNDKNIFVTGKIVAYNGKPEIVVANEKDIITKSLDD